MFIKGTILDNWVTFGGAHLHLLYFDFYEKNIILSIVVINITSLLYTSPLSPPPPLLSNSLLPALPLSTPFHHRLPSPL